MASPPTPTQKKEKGKKRRRRRLSPKYQPHPPGTSDYLHNNKNTLKLSNSFHSSHPLYFMPSNVPAINFIVPFYRMLKYLIVLLGICAVRAQQYVVKIQYKAPQLTLIVPMHDRVIASVLFHYGLRESAYTGRGAPTANGWEYRADLQIHLGDFIYAYADIQYNDGLHLITPNATHQVTRAKREALPPGGRRIRAVTFRDDFYSYNRNNWSPEVSMFGGFNWEFQVYTNDHKNIYVRDGRIYLRPILTTSDPRFDENFLHNGKMDMVALFGVCTNSGNYGCTREGKYGLLPPVMSGKISSRPTIRFGTVEVRAKIPKGDWLWPAIWMMPKSSHYGGWPRSGEIDIMESRGNAGDLGVGTVSSTLHWGPSPDQNRFGLTHGEKHSTDYHTAFHTWRLEWTTTHIRTFVDDQQILNVEAPNGFWAKGGFSGNNIWASGTKMAPFDQDFYIMFNVAVGGTNGFFPDNANWGVRKPWANNSPHAADDFWNGRSAWLPTWQGENTALVVDYVEFRN